MQNHYKNSIEFVIKRRRQDLLQAEYLYQNLLENHQDFYALEKEIRKAIRLGDTKWLGELSKQKVALLQGLNISPQELQPPPYCTLCQDSGFVDKGICRCVTKHYVESKKNEFQHLHLKRFEDIDYHFYDDKVRMKKHIDTVKAFCEKFPQTNKNTLLMYGDTGSGKTFLAGCITNQLIEKGCSVIFASSYRFFADMQRYHTTFDNTRQDFLQPYLDAEVLVLDDLGSEIMLKNITIEYLYIVISERQNNHLLTVITTNLGHSAVNLGDKSEDGNADKASTGNAGQELLSTRYGQRIASRLLAADKSLLIHFANRDKRTMSKVVAKK